MQFNFRPPGDPHRSDGRSTAASPTWDAVSNFPPLGISADIVHDKWPQAVEFDPTAFDTQPMTNATDDQVLAFLTEDWFGDLCRSPYPECTNTSSQSSLAVTYPQAGSSLSMPSNSSTGVYPSDPSSNSTIIDNSTVTDHLPQVVIYQSDPLTQTDALSVPLPVDLALADLTPSITRLPVDTLRWDIVLKVKDDSNTMLLPPIPSARSTPELSYITARESASPLVNVSVRHETLDIASDNAPSPPSESHHQRTTARTFVVRKIRQKSYTKGFMKRMIRRGNCSVSYGPNGYPLAPGANPTFSDMPEMRDGHEIAFPEMKMAQKMSIRYQFDGYPPYTRQANVSTKGRQPTKARLASVSAHEMALFCKRCDEQGKTFPHKLENLVLLRIDVVSDGSLQPSIGALEPA